MSLTLEHVAARARERLDAAASGPARRRVVLARTYARDVATVAAPAARTAERPRAHEPYQEWAR